MFFKDNWNVMIIDWSKGAKGPQYAMAAANTEVAGRQLGILLYQMVNKGLDPNRIHLIGFSLGAHVAGCASEFLKSKNILIGRITGLDPAGPLFRHNHLKEKSKKLDKSDATFVDIVHTDSSPVFIDGFGLWEPIGHVDFFANGGQEQPGCNDVQASIVATTFDRTLTRETACSHLRSFQLFLESAMTKAKTAEEDQCQFIAFKCPGGLPSYQHGQCFPQIEDMQSNPLALAPQYYTDIGRMGIDAQGDGVMFFVTRDKSNYCGTQLQAIVSLNVKTPKTSGVLILALEHENKTTNFRIGTEIKENGPFTISSLSTAEFNSLPSNMKNMMVHLQFKNYESKDHNNVTISTGNHLFIEKIEIRDIHARSWTFCKKTAQVYKGSITSLKMQRNACQ